MLTVSCRQRNVIIMQAKHAVSCSQSNVIIMQAKHADCVLQLNMLTVSCSLCSILMARMTKLKRITRNMYTTREYETGHVSCFVSGLLFSVVPDSKCILSCSVSAVRANNPLNESNEELRLRQWFSYFNSSFPYF